MKSIARLINASLILSMLFIAGCTAKSNTSNVADFKNVPNINPNAIIPILGKWQWAGTAVDENKNGNADDKEWKYRDATLEKEYAALNILLDGLDLNFNADNTGYLGKMPNDSTKFKWTLNTTGLKGTIINDAANIKHKIYFGKAGELINEETSDTTSDFEKKQGLASHSLTTFEMFKKVK